MGNMARNNGGDLLEGLQPEMRDGPFGLPYLKPKALPDLPDGSDVELLDDTLPGR